MSDFSAGPVIRGLAALALAGCLASDWTAQARGVSAPCGSSAVGRSACMIALILADLKANYRENGGGIASIKAGPGMSYTVELPQEERTDVFTYWFKTRGDAIVIARKTQSTIGY